MPSRAANKIKQRRERLKENQSPIVVPKPKLVWFWVLTALSVSTISYLSYLVYKSDFTNQLIIPIIVAVIVLVSLIIWYLPKFYVRSLPNEAGKDFDHEKERLKLEDDTRKTFAQIIGGIVFLGGLIFTYNTFRLQQDTYRLQQAGQFTDRFTKSVAQLGDDKIEIRLGGMYALERIAKDSPDDHWTVIEILSAYIRENSNKKKALAKAGNTNKAVNDNINEAENFAKIPTDIQTALTIIGRRKIEQDPETGRINLFEANLIGASLTSGANLSGANLSRADLRGTFLGGTNLSKSSLIDAYLIGAILYNTNLSGAYLIRAPLLRANLGLADLSRAVLNEADLSEANLGEADLRGANLFGVKNLIFEQLSKAIINESTTLPEYLKNRQAELLEISPKNLQKRNLIIQSSKK